MEIYGRLVLFTLTICVLGCDIVAAMRPCGEAVCDYMTADL